jgi:hypothetical protein
MLYGVVLKFKVEIGALLFFFHFQKDLLVFIPNERNQSSRLQ